MSQIYPGDICCIFYTPESDYNTMSQIYPGDVLDTNAVIEFLTSEEALELPDKIEEVKSETFESS